MQKTQKTDLKATEYKKEFFEKMKKWYKKNINFKWFDIDDLVNLIES